METVTLKHWGRERESCGTKRDVVVCVKVTWAEKSMSLGSCSRHPSSLFKKSSRLPKHKTGWHHSFSIFCLCPRARCTAAYVYMYIFTLCHKFSDDVDGFRLGDDSVESHQLVVLQRLHDVGFFYEGFDSHGAWLQSLHCHLSCVVVVSWRRRTRWREAGKIVSASPRKKPIQGYYHILSHVCHCLKMRKCIYIQFCTEIVDNNKKQCK